MSTVYSLSEMVDLALATPKIGVVNCFMLHAALHALIKRLNIGDCSATVLSTGDDTDYPWTELITKPVESRPEEVQANVVIRVNADSEDQKEPRTPEKRSSKIEREKKESSSNVATSSPSRHVDGAKEPQNSPTPEEGPKKKPSDGDTSTSQGGPKKKPSDGGDTSTSQGGPKKKPSDGDTSTSQGGADGATQDGDAGQESLVVQGESSDGKRGTPSQDSERGEDLAEPLAGDKEGTYMVAEETGNKLQKSVSGKGVQSSAAPAPTANAGQQFGLPFLERGVSKLSNSLNDVPDLVKELQERIIVNEKEMKELRQKVPESGHDKMKAEQLQRKLSGILKAVDKLENAVFGETKSSKAGKELDSLENQVDKMVAISSALENKVRDKVVPGESSQSESKKKSKKEGKRSSSAKKTTASDRPKEAKSSGSEPDAESPKKSRAKSETRKGEAVAPKEAEEEKVGVPEKGKATPDRPTPESAASERAESKTSPLETETSEEATGGAESGAEEAKPRTKKVKVPKEGEASDPSRKRRQLARSKTFLQKDGDESMDALQKKVNMVLHVMKNLEKVVKMQLGTSEKPSDEETERKGEHGKDDKHDDDHHESGKQIQNQVQVLSSRVRKLETDMQKLHQIVSSDNSSSSNLTKMVGDFLTTIATAPASPTADVDPQPKRSRKGKEKKKKKKEHEAGEKEEEGKEEKEEKRGESSEEENALAGEGNYDAEDKEKSKAVESPEIEDIVILKDSQPEKLSDIWDQLKHLVEALRSIKCNVVSLEKNSKNMAKALQMLMKGNMNIVDEDFEVIGELKMVVRKILADFNNVSAMVKQDREILQNLTVNTDHTMKDLEDTKSHFSGKMENLRNELIQKAERKDVDNMLSSVVKKLNISDYRREIDKMKANNEEQDNNFLMDIQQLKNDKYDRFEMDIFRMWVECKLSATKHLPQSKMGLELYQDDGAILKKQIPFQCLSCDKSLMITPQILIQSNPNQSVLPPHKRPRPMTANELDPSRLLKKRSQITNSYVVPLDKLVLEGKDNKLYQGRRKHSKNEELNEKAPSEVMPKATIEGDQLPPLSGPIPSKSERRFSLKTPGNQE